MTFVIITVCLICCTVLTFAHELNSFGIFEEKLEIVTNACSNTQQNNNNDNDTYVKKYEIADIVKSIIGRNNNV